MEPFVFSRVFPGVVYGPAVGPDGDPQQIGQGGAGHVFQFVPADTACLPAEAPRAIAVKEISLLSGAISVTQVEREVTIAMNLNHRNIVRVFDYDLSPATPSTVRIAMEVVQGRDLMVWAKERPYGEHVLCGVFSQLVEAMLYCHSQGVAHRDMKVLGFAATHALARDYSHY